MKREKTLTEYTSVISGPGIDEIYGILRSAVIPDPVQETSATNELYFIRDYLGNIKSIFDNNGEMLYYRLYDEFGGEFTGQSRSQDYADQTDLTQPCFTPFGFTSREFDEIADLYFYRSRYYDPQIGRFTQRDKFNEAGFITGNPAVIYNPLQLNDYTYVGNNPLIYTDPWGFCKKKPIIINWPFNDWYRGANARYSKDINIIFIFSDTRKKHPFIQKAILAHEMFHAMEQDIDYNIYVNDLDYRLEIERQAFEHEYNVLNDLMSKEDYATGNTGKIWSDPELKNRLDEIRNYKNYPNPGNLYHLYAD
jgi:RHS repeat-associated protein